MPPIIFDARRNPPTVYENVDVALARSYALRAEGAVGAAPGVIQPFVDAAQTYAGIATTAAASVAGRAAEVDRLSGVIPPLPAGSTLESDSALLGRLLAALVDAAGNFGVGLTDQGAWAAKHLRALSDLQLGGKISFDGKGVLVAGDGRTRIELCDMNYLVCICDINGNVRMGILEDGTIVGTSAAGLSALDVQDAKNKAFTAIVNARRVTTIQKPTASLTALYLYGQSLGQGDETWPALSRTPRLGNLMLGGNTLSSADGATFTQFTPAGLQLLKAMTVSGATTYPDETTNPATGGARGEPSNIGWTNGAKALLNDYLLSANATDRTFVTINVAKSGATIGELSKPASVGTTQYYNKYTGSMSQLATAAAGTYASVAVGGVMYMQGEFDYYLGGNASNALTYNTYRPKLEAMIDNMQADAVAQFGASGQIKPPGFFMYQTGAAYTRDVDGEGTPGLHIGMAQLDVALSKANTWMVGPVYPYTDKGGHFDSNGSRWYGHQIAKVWHRVAVEGRDWQPLRPIRIWQETPGSNIVYVAYHVPFAPLVFDAPQLAGGSEYNSPTRGFRLTDNSGAITVSSAEIVRDTIVKLTCSRNVAPSAAPKVWYASQGSSGNGMVRDSDPAVASDTYVYEPERGMYATANIAKFVGKPYALQNWGVAYVLPLGYSE